MQKRSSPLQVQFLLGYIAQLWQVSNFERVPCGKDNDPDEDIERSETAEIRQALAEISEQGSLAQVECIRRFVATTGIHGFDFGEPRFTPRDWEGIEEWLRRLYDPATRKSN